MPINRKSRMKASAKPAPPAQPASSTIAPAPQASPSTQAPSTGIEQLTDILILLDHIKGRVQDYIDGGGRNANNVMGIMMTEGFALAPKLNAAIKDADKIKDEVMDLTFEEFQVLVRTYVERPAFDITKAVLGKLLD